VPSLTASEAGEDGGAALETKKQASQPKTEEKMDVEMEDA